MSPIPAYLTALADLCDKHGTHAKHMGPELRLLAGLPWDLAPKATREGISHFPGVDWTDFVEEEHELAPCDIARAFLICSRARIAEIEVNDGLSTIDAAYESDVDRAAACAELAVLSSTIEHQGAAGTYPGIARPHDGTPEGARAAWLFIDRSLTQLEIVEARGLHLQMLDTYRRELEAMK